jgi:hypothetical protein
MDIRDRGRVVPFFDEKEVKLLRVLTDRGTEYCGNPEHHEYELYLAVEGLLRVLLWTSGSASSLAGCSGSGDLSWRAILVQLFIISEALNSALAKIDLVHRLRGEKRRNRFARPAGRSRKLRQDQRPSDLSLPCGRACNARCRRCESVFPASVQAPGAATA